MSKKEMKTLFKEMHYLEISCEVDTEQESTKTKKNFGDFSDGSETGGDTCKKN
jgi:hypothetical protein